MHRASFVIGGGTPEGAAVSDTVGGVLSPDDCSCSRGCSQPCDLLYLVENDTVSPRCRQMSMVSA